MKEQTKEKIKYFIYCRRSSVAEDKQVQSIETQIRELKSFAKKMELDIVEILEESQSAHSPGRPVFNSMMKRIEAGEANGVLVLLANRLSRNPIDSGSIIYLMDRKKLAQVRTPSNTYENDPNQKLMLALEFIISKNDSDNKSEHVKTGLKTRYLKGFPNGVAPIGFLNDLSKEKGNRGWLVDRDRFGLVKELLELFLTGRFSIRKLTEYANEKMGLRTLLRKKEGGKKLVLSYVTDAILKNSVFAGFFFDKDGTRYELSESVPRMISEEQYWEIQRILGSRGRPRPSKNSLLFSYKEPTKCGGCGGSVTAEHKYQIICSECKFKFAQSDKICCPKCSVLIDQMNDATYLHYIFYHCTKKKDPNCKEGSVQEIFIDNFLADYFLKNLKISTALRNWCIENICSLEEKEKQSDQERKISLEKTLAKKENELRELALMRARGQLNDEEFVEIKEGPKKEIEFIKKEIEALGEMNGEKLYKIEKAFDLARGVDEIFRNGTVEEKKSAISELGSNLTLKDRKLNIINSKMYSVIINGLLETKAKNPRFEPENIVDTSSSNSDFSLNYIPLLRE